MAKERLQKILSAAGIASRRKCEEIILEGLVSVNGKVVETLPAFADADKDTIIAAGRRIRRETKVYFLLNICIKLPMNYQGSTALISRNGVTKTAFCGHFISHKKQL